MLSFPRHIRVFLAMAPFDMRGQIDSMVGRVRRLGLEPVDGGLYVFFSRRRNFASILYFDGSGWIMVRKRLEKGTFELPAAPEGVDRVAVDASVLASLLEGIDLRAPRRRWYRRGDATQS